jgi:hypothetical protein
VPVPVLRPLDNDFDYVTLKASLKPQGFVVDTGTEFLLKNALPKAIERNSLCEVMYILCRMSWMFSTAVFHCTDQSGNTQATVLREAKSVICTVQLESFVAKLFADSPELALELLNVLEEVAASSDAVVTFPVVQTAFGGDLEANTAWLLHDLQRARLHLVQAVGSSLMPPNGYGPADNSVIWGFRHLQRLRAQTLCTGPGPGRHAHIWSGVEFLTPAMNREGASMRNPRTL